MKTEQKAISQVTYYQGFVSLINESVVEDSQALIPPDTHKLGYSQKSDGERHQEKQGYLKSYCLSQVKDRSPPSPLTLHDQTSQVW